mgnify:CR=1 FL=1
MKKIYNTIERWVIAVSGGIAIVTAGINVASYIEALPIDKMQGYLLGFTTLISVSVIIYLLVRPNPVKYDFVPNLDDIEYQSKLIQVSKHVRFRGLRFREALTNESFLNSLNHAKEVQLLVMAKFPSPHTALEEEHNKKYKEIVKLVKKLKSDGVNIVVKELPGCPEYNELIFDRSIVRRKKYDPRLLSAKNSEVEIYHWERAKKHIKSIIKSYSEDWESATHV